MKAFLTYGHPAGLNRITFQTRQALGGTWEERENSYYGGYLKFEGAIEQTSGEVKENLETIDGYIDPEEGWLYLDHKDLVTIIELVVEGDADRVDQVLREAIPDLRLIKRSTLN